jgi:hypothetical protein
LETNPEENIFYISEQIIFRPEERPRNVEEENENMSPTKHNTKDPRIIFDVYF